MDTKPQNTVLIPIINPNDIGRETLDHMNLDNGVRTIVAGLLKHGYDTRFSCDGHGNAEPYIAFRRETGDGTFERNASSYGLKLRKPNTCCQNSNEEFCPNSVQVKFLEFMKDLEHNLLL
jgi:hypothetical protein